MCTYVCAHTGTLLGNRARRHLGRDLKKVREQSMQTSGGRTLQAEEIAKEASVSGVEEEMAGQREGKDRPRRAFWAILGH